LSRCARPRLRVATAPRARRRRARSGLRRLGRAPSPAAGGAGHARSRGPGRSRPQRARRPPALRRAARVTPRKVVLYNPRAVFYPMPLALVAVASALDRRRYAPVIVDGRLEPDPVGRLVAECEDALALGVTALTGAPLGDALAVTRQVKQARPALPVVWGGWHPSLFPSECVGE